MVKQFLSVQQMMPEKQLKVGRLQLPMVWKVGMQLQMTLGIWRNSMQGESGI